MPHDDCQGESWTSVDCPYDSSVVGCCIKELEALAFPDGFPCSGPFFLNRDPPELLYPQYVPLPHDPSLCFLRLAQDLNLTVGATAFANFSFATDNTEYLFSMNASYRIFGSQAGAADGLAFVIHQDHRGVAAIGGQGGHLGIYAGTPVAPALVIELDTCK